MVCLRGCNATYTHRNDRRKGEQDAMAARQKRRMENLAARRDGKHKTAKGAGKKGAKTKARPGFEGTSRPFGGAAKARSSHGSKR